MGFVDRTQVHQAPRSNRELVRYGGDSHLLTFGYTGSGKTSGPVIMTAIEHPGSAVIIDPKGDVYEATAAHRRRMGQDVVLLDLQGTRPGSGSFNPIDAFVRSGGGTNLIARSLAATLVAPDPHEQAFWRNWAAAMLTGGIAYLLDRLPANEHTMGSLYDLFNHDDPVYHLAVLLDRNEGKLDRSTYSAFAGFLQLSERETRPSVLGSTQQHLMLWESDFIRALTDSTSFDLDGFIDGKRPTTIYIVPSPVRVSAYSPLLRLWFTALMTALMTRKSKPRHRTLILCDEAAALGKVEAFVTASCMLRSAGVQLWTFFQNPAQLAVYGTDSRTLIDNAGVVQLLGARNQRMAAEFAELVGGITAQEIMEMALDEQVVLIDGGLPQKLRRVRYFDIPEFANAVNR